MPKMNGFQLYREIKKIDDKVKVCFLTAGEMYYGTYADIFNKLDTNCFIRKPIENQELLKHLNEIINFN
jgi:YesN/AraC family two-component response regulator